MASLFRSRSCGLIDTNTDAIRTRKIGKGSVASLHSISMSSSFDSAELGSNSHQFVIKNVLIAALRKSLVTCSVEIDETSPAEDGMIIGLPTDVKHLSHVTFDCLNGFHGLPRDLQPQIPTRVPSASVKVFGVSPNSMQCSFDDKGNSVPTILLMIQRRLYDEGGLKTEGIFRINAENSQEEWVRNELSNGKLPLGIDVHCLAGLIKAWFRELPSGLLDSLTPEQVSQCRTVNDCIHLVKLLPPTEAALLNWAINLMADVVDHQHYNKMNAHNIAMVFAPNMTQMSDPLVVLMHAVQLMNLLKSLILETVRVRGESKDKSSQSDDKVWNLSCENEVKLEPAMEEENESESLVKDCENGEKISFREGVKRLCRHPVFQLSKAAKKTPIVL